MILLIGVTQYLLLTGTTGIKNTQSLKHRMFIISTEILLRDICNYYSSFGKTN